MASQTYATLAKEKYISSLGGWRSVEQRGIVAIGLSCENGDPEGWYIAVRTKTPSVADELPVQFDNVPIKAMYVGEIKAL